MSSVLRMDSVGAGTKQKDQIGKDGEQGLVGLEG